MSTPQNVHVTTPKTRATSSHRGSSRRRRRVAKQPPTPLSGRGEHTATATNIASRIDTEASEFNGDFFVCCPCFMLCSAAIRLNFVLVICIVLWISLSQACLCYVMEVFAATVSILKKYIIFAIDWGCLFSPAVKPPILGDGCIRVRIKYFLQFHDLQTLLNKIREGVTLSPLSILHKTH